MVWRNFHSKDKIETRELTQAEIERLYKDFNDEECRIELLRQAYEKAVGLPEQIEILAQVLRLKPTTI